MDGTMPRALVITGFGLNCEAETSHALEAAGWRVDRVHMNDLLADPARLSGAQLLVIIGGFSFGDHLAAGRVLAIRLKYGLAGELARFVRGGGLVIGICNGFQALCKLGLLPGFEPFDPHAARQLVTLTHNDSGVFRDDWVRLKVNAESPCVFTRGLDELELPVRHGEGKFLTLDDKVLDRLRAQGQIVYQYCDAAGAPTQEFPANPNGSVEAVAGICDATGRIFGTMPHPEACIIPELHPDFPRRRALGLPPPAALGLRLFENAFQFAVAEAATTPDGA
jgi:phosphoribosylformylglycinamidine synthase